jgi:hypothetical protein
MKRLVFWLLAAATAGLALLAFSRREAPKVAPAAPSVTRALRADPPAPVVTATEPADEPVAASADALALEEMHALVDENRISDARARAERFFQDYPGSPYGERVERLTGVHPRPRR